MELDRIRAWQLFIETSRLGSLALAAEALSFPLPKASRLISSLEDELGFQPRLEHFVLGGVSYERHSSPRVSSDPRV